jgi:hypothetical protein
MKAFLRKTYSPTAMTDFVVQDSLSLQARERNMFGVPTFSPLAYTKQFTGIAR